MFAAPKLSDYDVILLNTSGGKDSEVMIHQVYELAVAAGVADRLVAVHADLGRVEWGGTRDLAERQVAHYGIRFEVVERTDGADLLDYIERRGMWPSSSARYCTSDLKRGPIRRLMTRLANEYREGGGEGPAKILNCMGIRAAESPARAKKEPFMFDGSASTKTTRRVWNWLPIFDLSDDEVWQVISDNELEYHYAYDIEGVDRLSCVLCVLAGEKQVMAGIRHNPDLALAYVEVEERMGHTFKHNRSISDMYAEVHGAAPVTINATTNQPEKREHPNVELEHCHNETQ